jgi:hypothetical protein
MGGFGSGNSGGRPVAEAVPSIDIANVPAQNFIGNAWVRIKGIVESVPYVVEVGISWTACNYGGSRPWFLCPHCRRRARKLYLGDDGFGCRKCYRLVNLSTRENLMTRLWRKQERLEAKIIDAGGQYLKPKGMHLKNFNRIVDQIGTIEEKKYDVFIAGAAKMLGL